MFVSGAGDWRPFAFTGQGSSIDRDDPCTLCLEVSGFSFFFQKCLENLSGTVPLGLVGQAIYKNTRNSTIKVTYI